MAGRGVMCLSARRTCFVRCPLHLGARRGGRFTGRWRGLPGGPLIASSILNRFVVSWSISPPPRVVLPFTLSSGAAQRQGYPWGACDCLEYAEPFCGQLVHRVDGSPAVPSRSLPLAHVSQSANWLWLWAHVTSLHNESQGNCCMKNV